MQRPFEGEYNPCFQGYIDLVPDGNFWQLLNENSIAAANFFETIPAEKHDYRYAGNKWSIKELLIHLTDAERVFSYRALVAARGDYKTPLHPMDDHMYVIAADVSGRSLDSLIAEFMAVRWATEKLFEHITGEQSEFRADAVGFPITARALGYIIVGHMMHHMSMIRERYL